MLDRDADDLVGLALAEIGRDLQEDRRTVLRPRLVHRFQERLQRALVLQLAKTGRVG